MWGRRDLIRAGALGLLLTSAGGLMEACGGGDPKADPKKATGGIQLVSADIARTVADPALVAPAATTMDGFAARLYDAVAGQQGNLVISPYSVAVALSMTLAGARGTTAAQMSSVLGAGALGDRWHDGVDALTSYVDGLAGEVKRADGSKATLGITTANALFGQQGMALMQGFLEVMARDYGTGVQTVDFAADPDHVADLINGWVADHTDQRITDLIAHGVLSRDDRLALVNAISLTAPWEMPFDKDSTRPGPFHLADGSTVRAPLMTKSDVGVTRVDGSGWSAARIPYAGGTLAMTVLVPDADRFDAVEKDLAGGVLARALGAGRSTSLVLTLPRWTSRTSVSLKAALQALGMPRAFTDSADFGAMAEEPLKIGAALHQGYIAVDEDGTEAAAATAIVMQPTSGAARPETFTVDRPFLYAVHDTAHGTPLFVGRVIDPTR
ncbi:MAG TPA: serpin family protein [Nocardioides sp.]|nr:serpin family protein [Nocardioides sp.]